MINTALQFASNAKSKIDACVDHARPSLMVEIKEVKKAFHDAKKRGVNLRYITEITDENISFCKKLLTIVDELRHLDGIKGDFYVSETEYLAPASLHEKGKPSSQIIYSSIKENIEEQQYIFDTLWNKATSAEDKIKEIEQGIEPEYFRVITDYDETTNIIVDLAKSAEKEVLLLLPNDKSMVRMDRLGLVDYLIDKSQNKNDIIQIKIICPITDVNSDIINRILQQAPKNNNIIRIVNGNDTSFAIIVVDNAKFLKAELREPEAEEFSGAIGLSFYSNSKASVDSYRLFFELLWKERTTNEKLKLHDKMQEEFINIAAHELRTPTQSILGYSELLLKDLHDKTTTKDYEIIQAIYRNANRLQKLTQDILDVSRIESQTFKLNNETFKLADIISDAIKDVKRQIIDNRIKMSYKAPNNVYINADKERINQVISNLLNNAIKFTSKEGTISIITTEVSGGKVDEDKNENKKEVIISVKDTGSGIDPAIMLKLFEKFATKSDKGTGLGLFISKTIIEAHGGKIWAKNNPDSKGATFSFSLPIS